MADISNAEFEVLEALWEGAPASANEVVARLSQKKPWHEKTVKTLLNRLVKKAAIGFEKDQRRYLYYPLIAREDYTRRESRTLVERLFGGRLSPLVAGFAREKALSRDDIDELKALIKDWEQRHD
ncbi:BlaI/MecI/CopY family transcriptional regulator [Gallaecimonas sp. GXIMD4217]|uniref:BlaI/MecI/CopY family transcriptional regulator n=1 Tax=Gallaecimonas sp. GXIMD4217 TaxID=3131927 RepID=UPI00311B3880